MRSGWNLPVASTSSQFTRNVWQAAAGRLAATNHHSSNGVVKQMCRHYLRHKRNGINQTAGNWTKSYVDTCDRNYKSIGPQQTRPVDFNEALKSPSFKTELPTFLLNAWKEQAYAHIIHERHVYDGHPGEYLHFFVEDGVVRHDTIDVLGCNFDLLEADTLTSASSQGHRWCWKRQQHHHKGLRYWHRSHHAPSRMEIPATLWIHTGTPNIKNRRYENLSAIAMSIGSKMCQALPAYHAFTGTDYTSAIIRIISVLFLSWLS